MRKILTLCIIHQNNRILLGYKKRGFGQGKWNGFGGKVEPGEFIEDAARREVFEESKLHIDLLNHHGRIEFQFKNWPEIMEVHYYVINNFRGEPQETEEMRPKWFNIKEIPFGKMWPEARHVLPLILRGKYITGQILYDKKATKILKQGLNIS